MANGKPYAPAKKAAAVADLAAGMDLGDVCRKHGIPKNTAQDWRNALRKKTTETVAEDAHAAFMAEFLKAGCAIMRMLTAQAELLADHEYLRKQTTSDVIAHTKALSDRLERLIRLQQPGGDTVSDTAIVRAEIVDA